MRVLRRPTSQAKQMAAADFEEKQYECAFNNELHAGGPVFASGQVLESVTGYDSAADPGHNHVLWRILSTPRPEGVRLVPAHWPHAGGLQAAKLPSHPVSFIVQFKRPEYLQGSSAAQYHFWNQPYYRFTRAAFQHSQLRGLESRVVGEALVRYASPAFHRYAELERAQLRGKVVDSTGFVSPGRLGRHKTWTYIAAGTVGRGNPDGEQVEFDVFDALFSAPRRTGNGQLVTRSGLQEHLASLASACREVAARRSRTVDAWAVAAQEVAEVPEDIVTGLRDYAVVQSFVSHLGATWWLLDGDERVPVDA